MVYLRRIFLTVSAVFLCWRILSSGISAHYLGLIEGGDTAAVQRALAWDGRQPVAAYRRSLDLMEEDADSAEAILTGAYRQNMADPRPLLALASIAESQGDHAKADGFVRQAAQLRPSDATVQQQVAGYWAGRGETQRAMRHWSLAMDADPNTRDRLFPLFLKLAEDARSRGSFKTFAADPPAWWDSFFARVASRALDLDTVRVLYALRRGADETPLSEMERNLYMERLIRDGQITEAYLVWVNGLSQAGQEKLGSLFDGGFELEPGNIGFAWYLRKTDKVLADTATTYGVEGEKALHLIFKGREKPFGHVFQRLFLDQGTYRVTGKARIESLNSMGGIKWVVRCAYPGAEPLGESERFLGSSEWREFSFQFQVPEQCTAQEIRLVSGGSRPAEYKATGGAWFDAMAIRRLPKEAQDSGG